MWFADYLKNARKETGLSQWEFSVKAGISISTIQNWEQGRNEPQLEILGRLIRALGPQAKPLLERLGIESMDNAGERLRLRSAQPALETKSLPAEKIKLDRGGRS